MIECETTLNTIESVDDGVANNLKLPELISASKVASTAAPVNIVPNSVIFAVEPSCNASNSVVWYVLSVLLVIWIVNLAERNVVADILATATSVVADVEVSVVSIPYSSTWSLAPGEFVPIPTLLSPPSTNKQFESPSDSTLKL